MKRKTGPESEAGEEKQTKRYKEDTSTQYDPPVPGIHTETREERMIRWAHRWAAQKSSLYSTPGWTQLMVAIEYEGELEAMRLAQQPECNLDAVNPDGDTAFMMACCHHMDDLAMFLLRQGRVKADTRNRRGMTTLMCAALLWSSDVAKQILAQAPPNFVLQRDNTQGWTALQYAVRHENTRLVEFLAKADDTQKTHLPALQLAIEDRSLKCVHILLEINPLLAFKRINKQKQTPLIWAVLKSSAQVVQHLLRLPKMTRTKIHVKDTHQKSAVDYALFPEYEGQREKDIIQVVKDYTSHKFAL